MRSYAIGDIHGQLGWLKAQHALIEADRRAIGDAEAPVVHVGDLVDRGPDSRGVIDYLSAGIATGRPWTVLRGNHDRMFRGFMRDPDYHDPRLRPDLWWLHDRLGGQMTLASYGIPRTDERTLHDLHDEALARVPQAHLDFIDAMPLYFLRGDTLFVHAGVRPGVDLHDQVEDDFLWIRRGFLEDTRDHGALVVHGHTHLDAIIHYGNRLNIDTGAGYGHALSSVVIEGRTVFQLTPNGRVPIAPRA